jgi:hypothetical protein
MSLILKELGRGLITGSNYATANTIYTNPTTKDSMVTRIKLYNDHSGDVVVTICFVPDAAGVADTADVLDIQYYITMNTKETVEIDTKIFMIDTGETIQAYADVASKVNIFLHGAQYGDQT